MLGLANALSVGMAGSAIAPAKPTLTAPADTSVLLAGRGVTVSATSTDGDLDRIDWVLNPGAGEVVVASDSGSPYSATWNPAPLVALAGAATLVARAVRSGLSTDSDPIDITLQVTLASFFDASAIVHNWRADLGVLNASDAAAGDGDRVKTIPDQVGGTAYSQATGTAQPLFGVDTGANNRPFVKIDTNARNMVSSYSLPAPTTTPTAILAVMKLGAWANGSRIMASTDNLKKLIYCNGVTPNLSIYNNSARYAQPATVGAVDRLYALFTGTASDALEVSGDYADGLNAGVAAADAGRVLGCLTAANNNALPAFYEECVLNRALTLTERIATAQYVNEWYGLSLTVPTPPSMSLDVPALALPHGTVLSSALTPQTGDDIDPENSPTIDQYGIMGRSGIHLKKASLQRFLADAYVPLAYGANQPLTLVVRLRCASATGDRVLLGFGHTSYSTDNYLECYIPGGTTQPAFRLKAPGDVAHDVKALTYDTPFSDHVLAWTWDGATVKCYLNGAIVASQAVSSGALSPLHAMLGASYRTAPNDHFDGWIQNIELQPGALSQAAIQALEASWRASDGGGPGVGTPIAWLGDSITEGSSDTTGAGDTVGGGLRSRVAEFCRQGTLKIDSVGQFTQGFFQDPEHQAHGGYQMGHVSTDAANNLGSGNPYDACELAFLMIGTNHVVNLESGAVTIGALQTQYESLLDQLHGLLTGTVSTARMVVTTIPPVQPGEAGATAVGTWNAMVEAVWDAFDTAHPANKLFRWDAHAAIGAAWSSTYFKDHAHPNGDGYDLISGDIATPGTAGVCLLDATDGTVSLRAHLATIAA